ncbi:hypothetical protein HYV31_02055 [candidate division WWE3 bacterium]|nr:hypothetical protein [candidate division WWE3 bacterium]
MKINYLVSTLQSLFEEDTKIRTNYINSKDEKFLEQMKEIDEKSTKFITEVLKDFGLPTISKVGKKSSFQSWKLVQHSPDINLQEKYLELMEKNMEDVNKRDYAYLKDRVLLAQGKQQIYGTQFTKTSEGKYEPINLWDISNVDTRRKEVELDTLSENIDRMIKLYG